MSVCHYCLILEGVFLLMQSNLSPMSYKDMQCLDDPFSPCAYAQHDCTLENKPVPSYLKNPAIHGHVSPSHVALT